MDENQKIKEELFGHKDEISIPTKSAVFTAS